MRRPRTRWRSAALAAVLLFAVWLAPTAASAHSVLIRSTPTGAVSAAPTAVTLEFNERPRGRFSVVHVVGPDGERRDAGALSVLNDVVTQPVAGSRPAGVYTVDWRVVSADGHPVSGQWTFTASAEAAAIPVPTAAPVAATKPDDGGGAHLGHVLLAVVVVALIGLSWVAERFYKRRTGRA